MSEGTGQGLDAFRSDVIDAVQTVFLVAAPLAALALLAVLRLPELPLQTRAGAPEGPNSSRPGGPASSPGPPPAAYVGDKRARSLAGQVLSRPFHRAPP